MKVIIKVFMLSCSPAQTNRANILLHNIKSHKPCPCYNVKGTDHQKIKTKKQFILFIFSLQFSTFIMLKIFLCVSVLKISAVPRSAFNIHYCNLLSSMAVTVYSIKKKLQQIMTV